VNVVTFRILPPWYQAWWFYLLCALAFTVLIWGLVKWRTARIEKRKEELQELVTIQTKSIADQKLRLEEDNKIKSRLISIISHDMISPLKFLTYLSELMLNTFSKSDKNYRIVNSIATVSQDIESLSVSLLNWIRFHHESIEMKPERFNLKKLVTESVGIASKLANEKGIQFYIEIPEEIEVFQYAQAIGVIVYNLAINAVKYTDAGEIRIVSYQEGSSFSISIADTGPGMEAEVVQTLNNLEFFEFNYSGKEVKKYQFGYVIIKDLLRLSKGNMKVESILNKGTCVTIHFTNCK
jgi:signal transduction histidine kinase